MRVLLIYRHPDMGVSIGKMFRSIEQEMRRYAQVDAVYMPAFGYGPRALVRNIRAARAAVKAQHYDIVHITGTEHYLLPFLSRQRTVVTVHDLGFFTNQRLSVRSSWKFFSFIQTLRFAGRVTFISEKSQAEAKRLVCLREGRSLVVLDAVGKEYVYVPKQINTQCPRILHVGTKPNKNLGSTLIALKGMPCHLRIIGGLDAGQRALLKLYNIDYSQAENLTDEQIAQEYVDCDIVNFPSLYEGFGMPILEGQATGRPVVTSRLSPMQEVAGGASPLCDPADPASIRQAYEQAMADPERYVKAGLENVKKYQMDTITREYLNVYQQLIAP